MVILCLAEALNLPSIFPIIELFIKPKVQRKNELITANFKLKRQNKQIATIFISR